MYGHVDRVPHPPLTVLVTIGGAEFARFVRDEVGIIGVFEGGGLQRFSNRFDAFDAAVKRKNGAAEVAGGAVMRTTRSARR